MRPGLIGGLSIAMFLGALGEIAFAQAVHLEGHVTDSLAPSMARS